MKNKQDVLRRDFMKMTILAIGNVIGLSLTIPGVAYILGPVLKGKQGEGWIQLGSTIKVEADNPTLFKVNLQRQTGWVTDEEQLAVYVLTENGQDFIAMSNFAHTLAAMFDGLPSRTSSSVLVMMEYLTNMEIL